jgi:signal transduction histidine kinase
VCDTGPGIPESERERVFAQYTQIETQRPRTGGTGNGLGLNFCKMAIEAHGGQIWVESKGPLSGACIAFTLPRKAAMPNPAKQHDSRIQS